MCLACHSAQETTSPPTRETCPLAESRKPGSPSNLAVHKIRSRGRLPDPSRSLARACCRSFCDALSITRPQRNRSFDLRCTRRYHQSAGWSSLVARWAHNPKVGGSNPPPATKSLAPQSLLRIFSQFAGQNYCQAWLQPRSKFSLLCALRFGRQIAPSVSRCFLVPLRPLLCI